MTKQFLFWMLVAAGGAIVGAIAIHYASKSPIGPLLDSTSAAG